MFVVLIVESVGVLLCCCGLLFSEYLLPAVTLTIVAALLVYW